MVHSGLLRFVMFSGGFIGFIGLLWCVGVGAFSFRKMGLGFAL